MKTKSHLLVVEDEPRIARVLELELTHEGYTVTIFKNGLEAWEALQENTFDLLLLGVMLPGLSGIELLRRVRSRDDFTPVIMLTARDATVDKVTGLDLGANDYMTKPFEIEELLARIRACLRQTAAANPAKPAVRLEVGPLTVDTASHDVRIDENPVSLTNRNIHCSAVYLNIQTKCCHESSCLNTYGAMIFTVKQILLMCISAICVISWRNHLDTHSSKPFAVPVHVKGA